MTSTSAASADSGGGLTGLGWDPGWAAVFAQLPGTPARITRVDRGWLRVDDGGRAVMVAQPTEGPSPVTGDWIAYDVVEGAARVTGLVPRRTALVRRDPAETDPARPQVLAANMDQVWVIHGVDQPLRAGWLDRALVVAYGSGAHPSIVVTKADLPQTTDVVSRIAALAPATAVIMTSAVRGDGLDEVRAQLNDGRCAALLGRSGAGKSALINALAGTDTLRTAAVRAGDARGRHTTTRRSLTRIAGGSVIDTPGVRALGLWEPDAGLVGTFPDIAALASGCHFGDCSHRHEPGCAVLAARDGGALELDRYERFTTLRS